MHVHIFCNRSYNVEAMSESDEKRPVSCRSRGIYPIKYMVEIRDRRMEAKHRYGSYRT